MNDPYTSQRLCVERLSAEWIKYGKIIVAVDYDDTIFDYHGKGHTYERIINLIRRCAQAGAYICCFTGSPPEKYDGIRAHFSELNIPLSTINQNPFPMPFGNHGKMYFNILLDDRAGLGQAVRTLENALNTFTQHQQNIHP